MISAADTRASSLTPTDGTPATGSAHLIEQLRPTQRRLVAQRRVRDVLVCAASAGIGALGASGVAFLFAIDSSSATWIGSIIVAAVTSVILARRHGRDPLSPLTVGRIIETRLNLHERLSTALETRGESSTVVRALQRDAHLHAIAVEPATVAPWRWPMRWLAANVVVWMLAFLTFVTWFPPSGTAIEGSPYQILLELATEIETLATNVADPSLADLATELRDLALATKTPDDEPEVGLATLLDRVAAMLGNVAGAEAIRDRLQDVEAALATSDAAQQEGTVAPLADTVTATADPTFRRFEAWVDDEDVDARFSTAGPSASAVDNRVVTGQDLRDDTPPTAPELANAPSEGGAGEIIGAADAAQAGESRLAGRGSQALEGEQPRADFGEATIEAMPLLGVERDDGRHIEVELEPRVDRLPYDANTFEVGRWTARPQGAVPTDPPPFHHRDAAATFFLPSQDTAASR